MHITSRLPPRALALAGLVAGTLAVFSAAAPGAHALTLLTCGGSSTTTYSPGLTDTPGPVTINGNTIYGPCLNATDPLELRTGQSTQSALNPTASCTGLLTGRSGTRSIAWGNGQSSTYSYNQNTTTLAGGAVVIAQQGTITSGEFTGDSVLIEATLASGALADCSTTGVTSTNGAVELTIIG